MRSLNFSTLAIASLLAAVPLAGAQARSGNVDPGAVNVNLLQGTHISALMGQVDGVRQGIAYAHEANKIDAAEASRLQMRTDGIARDARRVAAAGQGMIPGAQYRDLLRRLGNVDQHLMTGDGFSVGG